MGQPGGVEEPGRAGDLGGSGRAAIDLNADLGEEGPSDAEILRLVSSASVACGFHAGGPRLMRDTCAEAARLGVRVGAHPSYADREGFGRRDIERDPVSLAADVAYQVGALQAVAASASAAVTFIKPHGALYNRAAWDRPVATAVLDAAARVGLPLLVLANSDLQGWAAQVGAPCFGEAFADRVYTAGGALVPRLEAGSVIEDPEVAAAQAVRIATTGTALAVDGSVVAVRADSICIHGDSARALETARAVREALTGAGVDIRAFG
ncbi:MAG: LamB/YcsF family protein [Acidimicrobiales bacterium]